jgi:hypothetical protein
VKTQSARPSCIQICLQVCLQAGVLLAAVGCQIHGQETREAAASTPSLEAAVTRLPSQTSTVNPSTDTPTATATASATPTQQAIGPGYVPGFNPLTGLRVANVADLQRVPVLISITEFPPSSRPQAGLSLAAQVWETSIGQGMSRFLAVYYGDYLEKFSAVFKAYPDQPGYAFAVGPIRSGRVGFEEIKGFYPGSLLLTRYASPEVAAQLTNLITIYARDPQDVNSAGLTLDDFKALDVPPGTPEDLVGLIYDYRLPPGGAQAPDISIIYNIYDQIGWSYDLKRGQYLRSQDPGDGTGLLQRSTDRLTGLQLGADNVVVLFAQHKFENHAGTILDIQLQNLTNRYGLLFRDGMVYQLRWSTLKQELQMTDPEGAPLALKPGQTYFEVLSNQSTYDPAGSLFRFHSPPVPTLPPTPTASSTPSPLPSDTPSPSDTPQP